MSNVPYVFLGKDKGVLATRNSHQNYCTNSVALFSLIEVSQKLTKYYETVVLQKNGHGLGIYVITKENGLTLAAIRDEQTYQEAVNRQPLELQALDYIFNTEFFGYGEFDIFFASRNF